jgi:hypothetical protein
MKTKITHLFLCSLFVMVANAQNNDSIMLRKIYDEALTNGQSYKNLEYLCKNIGGRLAGSPEAAKSVEFVKATMDKMGLDSVYLQPCMVPHWVRGAKELGEVVDANTSKRTSVAICALGGSISTPPEGLTARVVEVRSFDELAKLGRKLIEGRIVFYNRPMDPKHIETFKAYGGAVDQRYAGAMQAAKYGAVGVIVRSMTLVKDDYPHTGSMGYVDSLTKIPACAISTIGADYLSLAMQMSSGTKFFMKINSKTLADEPSFNVVGEIKGSEKPEKIIVVGGHLDSWDNGEGAHDDGAGVVQSIEVLRILKALNYKPKYTIRAVAFMNEENGLRGGKKYAELAKANNEKHIAAIETDAGGFSPRGMSMDCTPEQKLKVKQWQKLFLPYGVYDFEKNGGGADIGPLKDQGVALFELLPDSQRYFDLHHTANDTFDKVNKRELELGGATLASFIYLICVNGL